MIIGGGIAGTAAAETIRQKDQNGSIVVVSSEPHYLYSRVLLPEFVKGEVGIEKIMLRSAADYKKNNIEVLLGAEVKSADFKKNLVLLVSGESLNFQKLLIASGGRPKPWLHEAAAPDNIFRFQALEDAIRIKKFLSLRRGGRALVVGGGFISLEFLEILAQADYETTLLLRDKLFWPHYLDDEGLDLLKKIWNKHKISVLEGDEVAVVRKHEDAVRILTKKGLELEADFVGIGIGLERNLEFLPDLPRHGGASIGIQTNKHLETGFPSVWAAGDIVSYPDVISGKRNLCRTWSEAFMQGRIAGLNMSGSKELFQMVPAYSIGHLGQVITFIGDTVDNAEVVRPMKSEGEYVRILAEDAIIRGAVLINAQRRVGSLSRAILNKESVEKYKFEA